MNVAMGYIRILAVQKARTSRDTKGVQRSKAGIGPTLSHAIFRNYREWTVSLFGYLGVLALVVILNESQDAIRRLCVWSIIVIQAIAGRTVIPLSSALKVATDANGGSVPARASSL